MPPSPFIADEGLAVPLQRVLLTLALRQPDAGDREFMLSVMRADGWLPAEAAE